MVRKMIKKSIIKLISMMPTGDIILFESHNDYDGNAGALYQYMIEHEYNKKYKMVWAVKKSCVDPYGNSKQINKYVDSIMKNYYQFRAKYIFFDNEPPFRVRNRKSVSVYLTHGCPPLKNCKDYIKMNDFCDYAICTSVNVNNIVSEQYNIDINKMFISGLPRYDNLKINIDIEKLAKRRFKKYILWMPTFRKFSSGNRMDSTRNYFCGLPLIEKKHDLIEIDKMLEEKDICLIIKLHPNAFCEEDDIKFNNIIMLTPNKLKEEGIIDISYIFSQTDALISDYSTVVFDYMLVNKPLAFILDDFDDYKLGYSVSEPLDYMPGAHIYGFEDLLSFFDAISQGADEHAEWRNEISNYVHTYKDCNNCQRILERFIIN